MRCSLDEAVAVEILVIFSFKVNVVRENSIIRENIERRETICIRREKRISFLNNLSRTSLIR